MATATIVVSRIVITAPSSTTAERRLRAGSMPAPLLASPVPYAVSLMPYTVSEERYGVRLSCGHAESRPVRAGLGPDGARRRRGDRSWPRREPARRDRPR